MNDNPRVAFHTLGCKLNYSETSSLQQDFLERGFSVVSIGEETDIVVINTCTVTENADSECRKIIRRALRGAPNAKVAVTGCYAQLQPESIASIDGVAAVFGTAEKHLIVSKASEIVTYSSPQIFVNDFDDQPEFVGTKTAVSDSRTRAFLKLQDGCDYSCTFCTIPLARGPARAMEFTNIANEIKKLESEGFAEIVLTGINLGEYRAPTGERLIDVLELIEQLETNIRFRISSIEPNTIRTEIIEFLKHSKSFVPHLHIPLQSGSASLLRSMKRRYNPNAYRETIEKLVSNHPQMGLGIDVIVGFPGETEEIFNESMQFISDLPFTYLHVFTYSERANTPAASYDNKVPMNVRKARTARLRALSSERTREHNAANVGTIRSIVPETYSHETQSWTGYTENYVKVNYQAPELIVRGIHTVELTGLRSDGLSVNAIPMRKKVL